MDADEFVEAIKVAVRDGAISTTLQMLECPPGRRPPRGRVECSAWYLGLEQSDKRKLLEVISQAVDQVFGFLCVLDGVRAIENGERKGDLELRYIKDGVTLLNPESGPMLHDLYRSSTTS